MNLSEVKSVQRFFDLAEETGDVNYFKLLIIVAHLKGTYSLDGNLFRIKNNERLSSLYETAKLWIEGWIKSNVGDDDKYYSKTCKPMVDFIKSVPDANEEKIQLWLKFVKTSKIKKNYE